MSEPAPQKAKSKTEIGADNLAKLQRWLDAASAIPERGGKVNMSGLAFAAGLDRQVLYRPEAQSLIEAAVERVGLAMPEQPRGPGGDAAPAWATQRIKDLEEQLAVAKAEAHDLRARLRRYEHLERHLADTGLLAR